MTDNVRPMFSKGARVGADGKPASSPAEVKPPPPAVALNAAIEFHDWETWWLPAAVSDWVEAQARANSVPKALPLAAAMCAMATLLQGKVEVEIRPGWREQVSIFWLLASPSGTMKSRVLDAAKAPIQAIERAAADAALEQQKLNRRTRNMLEGRCKKLRGKFAGKGSLTPEDRNELDCLERDLDQLPNDKAPAWLVSNINPANIPKVMRRNQEAEDIARVSVMADEDTFLRNMMGRHSGHSDLEAILSGYTGGAIELVRKSVASDDLVEVRLQRCHLTLLVLTQPHVLGWMRDQPILADQGFWGRTIVTSIPRGEMPALDTPPVPEAIQSAWGRLLASLHALPAAQVIKVPEDAWEPSGPLAKLYADVRAQVGAGQGAEAYAVRAVGRVCRFWAIAELAGQFERSHESHGRQGRGGLARMGKGIVLSYLPLPLYYQALRQAQDLQPNTPPLDAAPLRVLAWVRRFDGATVGSELPLKRVMNANHLRKDVATDACDSLVEHGYLKAGRSHRNRNGTTTTTYIVVAHYAEGERNPGAAINPIRPLPSSEPPDELEPEDAGPIPDSASYLGEDDFDPFEP